MRYTGKVFYILEGDTEVLASLPKPGMSFMAWREAVDDEDEDNMLYVSDAGIVLGFEEFWG